MLQGDTLMQDIQLRSFLLENKILTTKISYLNMSRSCLHYRFHISTTNQIWQSLWLTIPRLNHL
ncbi:hypothetical protein Bca4012_051155 [Brassica carinata]|uniref:Uncharacterized protein n=2 Tax=Brassica TaxID=3705 RepID=A0A3P6DLT7_BRAOL|nr:unnamed protein product [Brassica napus]CDY37631.1 BnaCnng08460D [Brassica napus]VDD24461.1 unnamed protein product [Brassica oleracea]